MCLEPNLSFVYVGGKLSHGDAVEAKLPALWLVRFLRGLLADGKTICPQIQARSTEIPFPIPCTRWSEISCFVHGLWNHLDKLLRYTGGKICLHRWGNLPGGPSRSLTPLCWMPNGVLEWADFQMDLLAVTPDPTSEFPHPITSPNLLKRPDPDGEIYKLIRRHLFISCSCISSAADTMQNLTPEVVCKY